MLCISSVGNWIELNWIETKYWHTDMLTYWQTDILTYWIEWWIEFRRNGHVEKLSLSWIQTLVRIQSESQIQKTGRIVTSLVCREEYGCERVLQFQVTAITSEFVWCMDHVPLFLEVCIHTLSSAETVVVCYSMIIYWDFNVARWNNVLHYLLMLSPLLFPLHCMCGVHYFCVRHCLSLLMPSLLWCLELLCLCAWADNSQFSLCFRMGNCIYSEDTVWEPGRPCQRAVYALYHKQSTSFDICI